MLQSSVDGLLVCCKQCCYEHGLQISLQDLLSILLYLCIPSNDIPGSNGNSVFNFLWNQHTTFHTGYPSSQQQCIRVSVSPPPPQHLLFSFFCASVKVSANETVSWPLPTGDQHGCPSNLKHPSFSCLKWEGDGPGRGQNWRQSI